MGLVATHIDIQNNVLTVRFWMWDSDINDTSGVPDHCNVFGYPYTENKSNPLMKLRRLIKGLNA